MLRPRVPALEAEVARLQVEVQDRNKGLRVAHNEEGLARAEVGTFTTMLKLVDFPISCMALLERKETPMLLSVIMGTLQPLSS